MPTLALLLALLSGCTAVNGYVRLDAADRALARADEQNARELAPYEYTQAQRYLEKAVEEAGYSDWGAAHAMAEKSAEWADKAVMAAQAKAAIVANPDAVKPKAPLAPQGVATPAVIIGPVEAPKPAVEPLTAPPAVIDPSTAPPEAVPPAPAAPAAPVTPPAAPPVDPIPSEPAPSPAGGQP